MTGHDPIPAILDQFAGCREQLTRHARTLDEQRDVPSGEIVQEAQRSWVTVVEAAVAGALATDVYNDVKAAGKTVVDKIRKPPPGPSPDMSQGGSGDDAGPEAGRSS